jgi:hypothetical protein
MTDEKKFSCPRCGLSSNLKANISIHLKSKKPCETKYSNISREDVLESLKRERKLPTEECAFCKKVICKKSMKKHMLTCTEKPSTSLPSSNDINTDERDKRLLSAFMDILQRELGMLKQQMGQTPNQTVNNVVNNTINININPFGNENMSHLTSEFLSHCLLNPTKGITKLIENIHYSDNVPENKNIRFKSNKNNTFEKFLDDQWIECDASNTLDELIRKGYRVLNEHYVENFMDNPDYDDDLRRQSIERFRFLADTTCQQYSSIKRDIRLLIKNKTCYVIAHPDIPQITQ